jgi:hypothetical protein
MEYSKMISTKKGNLPHVEWIDLKGDGVFHECCVLKRDSLGNIMFFPVNALDRVDRRRLGRILSSRLAPQMECWDLLSQQTLNNGVNALEYFHPLVKTITSSGKVYNPQQGVVGTGQIAGKMDTRSDDVRVAEAEELSKRRER